MSRDNYYTAPFFDLINRFKPIQSAVDSWRWKIASDGRYSTNSAYCFLVDEKAASQIQAVDRDHFRWVWNKIVPLKVSAMAWRLLHNRLPTKDNLVRRNVQLSMDQR